MVEPDTRKANNDTANDEKAQTRCREAEKQLAEFFARLGVAKNMIRSTETVPPKINKSDRRRPTHQKEKNVI